MEEVGWCGTRKGLAVDAKVEWICFVAVVVGGAAEEADGTELVVAARAVVWRSGGCLWRRDRRRWRSWR